MKTVNVSYYLTCHKCKKLYVIDEDVDSHDNIVFCKSCSFKILKESGAKIDAAIKKLKEEDRLNEQERQ